MKFENAMVLTGLIETEMRIEKSDKVMVKYSFLHGIKDDSQFHNIYLMNRCKNMLWTSSSDTTNPIFSINH
jgi:hypothetical protein